MPHAKAILLLRLSVKENSPGVVIFWIKSTPGPQCIAPKDRQEHLSSTGISPVPIVLDSSISHYMLEFFGAICSKKDGRGDQ